MSFAIFRVLWSRRPNSRTQRVERPSWKRDFLWFSCSKGTYLIAALEAHLLFPIQDTVVVCPDVDKHLVVAEATKAICSPVSLQLSRAGDQADWMYFLNNYWARAYVDCTNRHTKNSLRVDEGREGRLGMFGYMRLQNAYYWAGGVPSNINLLQNTRGFSNSGHLVPLNYFSNQHVEFAQNRSVSPAHLKCRDSLLSTL